MVLDLDGFRGAHLKLTVGGWAGRSWSSWSGAAQCFVKDGLCSVTDGKVLVKLSHVPVQQTGRSCSVDQTAVENS